MKSASLILLGIWLTATSVNAQVFVVGPAPYSSTGTNSFLLPLNRPADITKARILAASDGWISDFAAGIVDPAPSVVIQVGSDGINRDVLAPGQPLWSWRVSSLSEWASGCVPEAPLQHP